MTSSGLAPVIVEGPISTGKVVAFGRETFADDIEEEGSSNAMRAMGSPSSKVTVGNRRTISLCRVSSDSEFEKGEHTIYNNLHAQPHIAILVRDCPRA